MDKTGSKIITPECPANGATGSGCITGMNLIGNSKLGK